MAGTAARFSDGADEIDPEPLRESFNRIVRVAIDLLGGVAGEVAIRRREGVWRSSGRDVQYAPLAPHVEAAADALWIPDWREDPRSDPTQVPDDVKVLRFYAGAPIRLVDGWVLGVLSVMGDEIKPRDETKVARLIDLASLIADEVERRMALLAKADAEADAAAARATLAALVENAPFAVSMTDHDVRLLQVSRRWREERGLVGADIIGRSLYELFPAVSWAGEHERILAGETLLREVQLVLPDGRQPWVRYEHTPWRDASGRIGGILSMSVDVTELVETLQRAQASEQRLKLAMEIGDLAMWEMDLPREAMIHAGVNPIPSKTHTLDFFDLTEGGGVWKAVHPHDRPALLESWKRHCETGAPFRGVVRLLRSDGPHVWVQVASEAIRDQSGEIVRIVNVLRNVDEIKRSEIALQRA
ncbi:MAG TPA: PAS domain S-box protein, partial [Caulobacteraceae bacterium]|nr:PAS domain S-box protein [Caulobacteraceae bacterium]